MDVAWPWKAVGWHKSVQVQWLMKLSQVEIWPQIRSSILPVLLGSHWMTQLNHWTKFAFSRPDMWLRQDWGFELWPTFTSEPKFNFNVLFVMQINYIMSWTSLDWQGSYWVPLFIGYILIFWFIKKLTDSFPRYSLSISHVLNTVLGTGVEEMKKYSLSREITGVQVSQFTTRETEALEHLPDLIKFHS